MLLHQPLPTSAAALLTACRRLLRPLVRLMIRGGVTFPAFADALRHLFIDVMATEILISPDTQTISRVSLLTGIHRKEIRRYREMPADAAAPPELLAVASQIIARWLGSPPFTDDAGQPLALPRIGEPGRASFDALVGSVTTDIRSQTILDDWLSRGLVHLTPAGDVALDVQAFIPAAGGDEQMFYFTRNLHDHLAAAATNISTSGRAQFLDRSVHYDELTPDQARELEAFARDVAVQALLEVNRKAQALVKANENPDVPARHRVNFGIFVFEEEEVPTSTKQNHAGGGSI